MVIKRYDINILNKLRESGEISEEEYRIEAIRSLPSIWIEEFLRDPKKLKDNIEDKNDIYERIKLRKVQKQFVDSTAKRKILRFGRQSGKTFIMACDSIAYAILFPSVTIGIFAPNKSHIINIMRKTIWAIIQASPDIIPHVDGRPKDEPSRYIIRFKNGSEIIGVAVNQNPTTVRGLTCNIIYVDEAAYLTQEAEEAVNAVTLSVGSDAIMTYASTPAATTGLFYRICLSARENKDFVEFYQPTTAIESWDKETEKTMRILYPIESAYNREILALFDDPEENIFKSIHIDRAIENGAFYVNKVKHYYNSSSYKNFFNIKYTFIGVDWNSAIHGVQIIVLGIDEDKNKIVQIDSIEVKTKEFTQTEAVKKIIEVIGIYDPVAVYVDKGYGDTQIELLLKAGKDFPQLRIKERLKFVAFNTYVKVKNPVFARYEKRPIKPFLVDLVALNFASDRYVLLNDMSANSLPNELKNYKLRSITEGKSPKFTTPLSDHKVDAFLLATYAIAEIYDQSINPKAMTNNIFFVDSNPFNKSFIDEVIEKQVYENMKRHVINNDTFRSHVDDIKDFLTNKEEDNKILYKNSSYTYFSSKRFININKRSKI